MPEIGTSGSMSGDGKRAIGKASSTAPILDSTPTVGPLGGSTCGFGFAIRSDAAWSVVPGSVGSFTRSGAWGTCFWVDPAEQRRNPTRVGQQYSRSAAAGAAGPQMPRMQLCYCGGRTAFSRPASFICQASKL
jgi:hypothetical protein